MTHINMWTIDCVTQNITKAFMFVMIIPFKIHSSLMQKYPRKLYD